ncbi:hypothetical protein N9Z18_01970 [Verrucomicrobiales bacterium]|jgi:hypothetical protein|nr:hypothetical protein [Verrucomicrobiales bacterium]
MGNIEGDVLGGPIGCFQSAALMAWGAETPGFAGEGKEFFMAAVGAVQTGEALGEVTATVVFFDDLNSISAERSVGFAVVGFVTGLELVPTLVDDLPKRGPMISTKRQGRKTGTEEVS